MAIGSDDGQGLSDTRSSYVTKEASRKGRGRSTYGRMFLLLKLFIVSIVVVLIIVSMRAFGGPIINIWNALALDTVLFGALFLVNGWLEFYLAISIKNIPLIKVDAAPAGVNEVSAMFVPEKNSLLVSPLSHQKCIYYKRVYQEYKQEYSDNGNYFGSALQVGIMKLMGAVEETGSRHWATTQVDSDGVPALLTDNTGYLAIDLANADIDLPKSYYYGSKLGSAVTIAKVGDTRVIESVIPVKKQYFVMGRVSAELGKFNGKPIKEMTYDSGTKLLTVRGQSKGDLELIDMASSGISFAIGIVLIVVGLRTLGII